MASGDPERIVLVSVDASGHSKRALNYYVENIYRQGDFVVLCHIAEQPKLHAFSLKEPGKIPVDDWQKSLEEAIGKTNALEQEYSYELTSKKIPHKMVIQGGKNPGQGVCDVAAEEKAGLIIMGSRGMNALRRTFVGSVSEYVLHHVSKPCLIIPPEN